MQCGGVLGLCSLCDVVEEMPQIPSLSLHCGTNHSLVCGSLHAQTHIASER